MASKLVVDVNAGTLRSRGRLSRAEINQLKEAAATRDQRWAIDALAQSSNWFESVLQPGVIAPVKKLRSWAFVLCFLCIGLSTRFKDLAIFGLKPFWAFSLGVLVNVPLGFVLSTMVFVRFWSRL
jgi:hypothetical protein